MDQRAADAFALQLRESIVIVDGDVKPPDWADPRTQGAKVSGLAVVVANPEGGRILVTGGVFGGGIRNAVIRRAKGEPVPIRDYRALGDGGLVELDVPPAALAGYRALPLASDRTVERGVPVLTVNGVEADKPSLFFGVVLNRLEPPLAHIFATDISFPHGAPLVSADGRLLGVTYRNQPTEQSIGWAIGADTLDAWLRPEGPPAGAGTAADSPE